MTENEFLDMIEQETGRRPPPHIPAQKRLRDYRKQQEKLADLEARRRELQETIHCTRYGPACSGSRGHTSPVERAAIKLEAIGRELEQTREAVQVVEIMLALVQGEDRKILKEHYLNGKSTLSLGLELYLSERAVRGRIKKQLERLDYYLLRKGL